MKKFLTQLRWSTEIVRALRAEGLLSKFGFYRIVGLVNLGVMHVGEKFWVVRSVGLPGELARLCDLHGSDKGEVTPGGHPYDWPSHTYADVYEFILGPIRDRVAVVLECGIGTNNPDLSSSMGAAGRPGASLRVWRDFFPHAKVIGLDIDREILFSEDRITTAFVDQTDKDSIEAFFASTEFPTFDVIIDDGLHEFSANRTFFEAAASHLAPGGFFFIEDCNSETRRAFVDYFADKPDFRVWHFGLFRAGHPRVGDNALVVVQKA